jgi:AcrR family transcriptional regulator
MAKKIETATGYSSPVRDEAKQATRERIIDALVRVVIEDGVHAFSVATVADRAGVSHRTVYRHFPSREELLEGLAEAVDGAGAPEAGQPRAMIGHATRDVGPLFRALDEARDRASAEFIIGVALRHSTRGKRQRWALIQAEVRERFPALSSDEQLAGAAALRALVSSNAWFHLCVQLGVPAEPAAQGITRAVTLVLEDLAQRNEARSRPKRKREKP